MPSLRQQPLLIVPLFVLLYGYGTIDAADFYQLSASPLALNPDSGRQFLHSSPLPFFIGYPVTRLAGPRAAFVVVFGAGLAFFLWSLGRLASTRYGARRNDATLMLLTTPLLIVMTQYIGKSDAWMAGAVLLLPTLGRPAAQVAVAALLILGHAEMGLLILGAMAFLGLVPWRTALAGAAIGIGLVLGYHHVLLPSPPESRADVGMRLLRESIEAVLATPVLHLIFTFGSFWLCVWMAWPMNRRWLLVVIGTAVVACVTIDFTRVFTLVGLPAAIVVVDRLVARLEADPAGGRAPAWLGALPVLALVQAHLIGLYSYDSRLPELAARWFDMNLR